MDVVRLSQPAQGHCSRNRSRNFGDAAPAPWMWRDSWGALAQVSRMRHDLRDARNGAVAGSQTRGELSQAVASLLWSAVSTTGEN